MGSYMKYYNLSDVEAKNFNSINMFLSILPKQHPDGYNFDETAEMLSQGYISEAYSLELKKTFKLPYAVGDIVGCRETWGKCYTDCCPWGYMPNTIIRVDNSYSYCVVYKSSFDRAGAPRWRSPVTMPREAIRKWVKVVSVDVKYDDKLEKWVEICTVEEIEKP